RRTSGGRPDTPCRAGARSRSRTARGLQRSPRSPIGVSVEERSSGTTGSCGSQEPEAGNGPDPENRSAHDLVLVDRPEDPGIRRVVPIVAHDPQLALRHFPGLEIADLRLGEVGLVEGASIDVDAA